MPSKPPSLKPAKARPNHGGRWDHGQSSTARGYGRAHRLMRRQVLIEEPLCRECERQGRVSATVIADHIIPKAEGGSDERTNYQGLCGPCSAAKTAREAQRGRQRARP